MAIVLIGLVFALLSGVIGALIGRTKGRVGVGLLLGLLFGFIGWIVTALLSRTVEREAQYRLSVQDAMSRGRKLAGADVRTRPTLSRLLGIWLGKATGSRS